jgi:protein TonB
MNTRLRWIGSFALVAASYAAAGTVLIAWKPNYEAPALQPQPVVLLELEPLPVPPPPQVIPPPLPEPPPEPAPLPKVEQPKPEAVLPPPPKKKPHRPRRKHEEPPPPQVAPPPPAPAMKAPPAPAPVPQVASLPPSPDVLAAYEGLLYAYLQRSIRYPRGAVMRHEQGVAQVHLVIDGAGRLSSFRLLRSSGHDALDKEAVALLQRAPLPPRPAELGNKELSFDAPIVFKLR